MTRTSPQTSSNNHMKTQVSILETTRHVDRLTCWFPPRCQRHCPFPTYLLIPGHPWQWAAGEERITTRRRNMRPTCEMASNVPCVRTTHLNLHIPLRVLHVPAIRHFSTWGWVKKASGEPCENVGLPRPCVSEAGPSLPHEYWRGVNTPSIHPSSSASSMAPA